MKWIKKRENQIFFWVAFVAIFVAISPLLSKYCLLGHDSEYHMLRIEALKRQIEMGKPFLRVNPMYFGGAGYASSLFYPDLLLFIPAILRVVGFSIKTSYHLFMIFCIALGYGVSYACGKHITKNRYIGMLFAVIFTLASYHLDDIIVRAAAGEYVAFVFIPIAVYGIYNLCFEDMDKPWILGLGMGMLLLTHTLSFVLCVLMAILMLIFNFEVFLRKPKLLLKVCVTAIVTMIVTAFYWIPVLEQFLSETFYVSKPWIEPAQSAVKVESIFSFAFPTLGASLILLIIPRVILFRNDDDKIMKFSDQCLTSGLVFAFLASDIIPWNKIGKFVSVVQFPWRLYTVSTVLIAFSAAVIIYRLAGALCIGASNTPKEFDEEHIVTQDDNLVNKYGVMLALVLSVMTISAIYGYSLEEREYFDFSNDYYDYKPYTASVIAGEWLPMTVDEPLKLIEQSEHVIDNNGNDVPFVRDRNEIIVNTEADMEYIDVPFVYYKGYRAKGESGQTYRVDGQGENGIARVYLYGNIDTVKVSYTGTALQRISDIISLLSIAGLVILCIKKKKKVTKK